MAFEKRIWTDRQSEFPTRRKLSDAETGNLLYTVDVERDEGLVTDDGVPFNAATMNDLEERIDSGVFEVYDYARKSAEYSYGGGINYGLHFSNGAGLASYSPTRRGNMIFATVYFQLTQLGSEFHAEAQTDFSSLKPIVPQHKSDWFQATISVDPLVYIYVNGEPDSDKVVARIVVHRGSVDPLLNNFVSCSFALPPKYRVDQL